MSRPQSGTTDHLRVFHEIEVQQLKGKLADLQSQHKQTVGLLHESEDRLAAILGLKGRLGDAPPVTLAVKPPRKGKSETTPVLVSSDWHLEERVDPRTVNGINEYNLDIAERRVKASFEVALSMVEMLRQRSTVRAFVLAVLGDLITNTIHDELLEGNYLSPTQATLKAYRLLCGGIDFLLKEGDFEELLVPCAFGNHGRSTLKPRVATAAVNSYEWMMYQLVAERYAGDKRVKMSVADGYLNFVDVYTTRLRLHHGNGIKYQGGVGGVTIPLNKAIAQWNKMRQADIDVLGHWHTLMSGRDHVINGSVVGYNAYALQIKASYEPPAQAFFLIHPRYGKTVEIPIFLDRR